MGGPSSTSSPPGSMSASLDRTAVFCACVLCENLLLGPGHFWKPSTHFYRATLQLDPKALCKTVPVQCYTCTAVIDATASRLHILDNSMHDHITVLYTCMHIRTCAQTRMALTTCAHNLFRNVLHSRFCKSFAHTLETAERPQVPPTAPGAPNSPQRNPFSRGC